MILAKKPSYFGTVAVSVLLAASTPQLSFSQTQNKSIDSIVDESRLEHVQSIDDVELRAQLTAKKHTILSSELQGRVLSVSVEEGQSFKQGDTLVEFDCLLQSAQKEKSRAQVYATKVVHKGNIKLAKLNAVGEVELASSEAEVSKAQADLYYFDVLLSKCTVEAPFDGHVAQRQIQPLQFVQQGQPLLDILDISDLKLEFFVPSRWLQWLQAGDEFSVNIEDTDKQYPAKILRTAVVADPVSQSIKVIADIHGEHPELLPGMSGRVHLVLPVLQQETSADLVNSVLGSVAIPINSEVLND